MTLLWRYLLKNYLKVLVLSVASFIAILLVSRLEEIAHFASLGAPLSYLALFTLYQIPYILPIAIPISCLISAMILFQRLSHTHELTAIRAGGFSIKQIATPLLIAGALLSLASFYIASELATSSHLATRKMAYDLTSGNPLLLLQSAKIAKLKGSYVQMGPVRNGQEAQDLLIALKNSPNERIRARKGITSRFGLCETKTNRSEHGSRPNEEHHSQIGKGDEEDRLGKVAASPNREVIPLRVLSLCLVKKVKMEEGNLKGKGVSVISTVPGSNADHLVIENQEVMTSPASEFARLLRNKGWKIANDHLKLSLLRVREQSLREEGGEKLAKCHSEMARRASLGIAAFTFTLMGLSFGMEIGRNRTKRGILSVLFLAGLTLITFFVGKELDHLFWIAASLFLLPHALIAAASIWNLSRVSRGIG
jgi:lipopolysaccharide export system permease protein